MTAATATATTAAAGGVATQQQISETHLVPHYAFKTLLKKLSVPPKAPLDTAAAKESAVPKTPRKPKGPARQRKDFDAKFHSEQERLAYDFTADSLSATIGTLTCAKLMTVGKRVCFSDSLSGAPIPFYCYSIPHYMVGQKKKEGIAATTDLFFGSFISELSMMTFLLRQIGLSKDHIMVLNTAEYYGFKNLEKRYPDSSIDEYWRSVSKSRILGGKGVSPQPSQLARGKKTIKNAWYYNRPGSEIAQGLKSIDTDRVLAETGFEKRFGYDFYCYQDFIKADNEARQRKVVNAQHVEYWSKIIQEHGEEYAQKLFGELVVNKGNKWEGLSSSSSSSSDKKRKRPSSSSSSSGAANKKTKIENHEGLKAVMKTIQGKIITRCVIDYFDFDLYSSPEVSPPLSDSFSESDDPDDSSGGEEEEVIVQHPPAVIEKPTSRVKAQGTKITLRAARV